MRGDSCFWACLAELLSASVKLPSTGFTVGPICSSGVTVAVLVLTACSGLALGLLWACAASRAGQGCLQVAAGLSQLYFVKRLGTWGLSYVSRASSLCCTRDAITCSCIRLCRCLTISGRKTVGLGLCRKHRGCALSGLHCLTLWSPGSCHTGNRFLLSWCLLQHC